MESKNTTQVDTRKKGRVGRKKKAPISSRVIWVYFDTPQEADRWKEAAKKVGMSTSNYVHSIVDKFLANHGMAPDRKELDEKIKLLTEENESMRYDYKELKTRYDRLDTLCTKYEADIQELENSRFKDNQDFEGARPYQQKLIALFKEKKYLNEMQLYDDLGISPSNTIAMQAIGNQLDNLLMYGIIKSWRGGFQWQG